MTDRELLDKVKQKDIACLEKLMDMYSAYIAKVIVMVGCKSLNSQDIEEIAADVFVTVWQNAEKINLNCDSMKPYLAAIARNKAKTVLSSRKVEMLPLLEDIITIDDSVCDDVAERETYSILNRTVSEMEEPDREIFIRRYYYFEKIREIANHLSMNKKTVETRLSRGKEKLRLALVERGVGL